MDIHRKTRLVVDAVTVAVANRPGAVAGAIHHPDQGSETRSRDLEFALRHPPRPI